MCLAYCTRDCEDLTVEATAVKAVIGSWSIKLGSNTFDLVEGCAAVMGPRVVTSSFITEGQLV